MKKKSSSSTSEQSRREDKVSYESLVDALPHNLYRIDLEGRLTFVNKALLNNLGVSLEDVLGKTAYDFYPEELARKYRLDDQRVMETGAPLTLIEENILPATGEKQFVEVIKTPLYDNTGAICGIQGVFWDITVRKQTAEKIQQELLEINSRIVNNSTQGIRLFDHAGQCVLANDAAARMGGAASVAKVLEQNYHNIPQWKESGLYVMALQALESGAPRRGEFHMVTPFGKEVWSITDLIPYRIGAEQYLLVLHTDVSEFRRTEQALIEAKKQAEAANQAKGNFLANMSHEIRTPMNAILGMTHLVLGTELNTSQRDYLEEIDNAAQALLGIINDILDFARIEAGKLAFELVPVELGKEITTLQSMFGLAAREKSLQLEFTINKDVPRGLVCDPLRLRQVLSNFISNAIKFTHRGRITVTVSLLEKQDDRQRARLRFEVMDTGIGMSDEQLANLFKAFNQVDNSITRRFGGTGLGLALTKKLVELMEGEIGVESELRKGSRFHFSAWFGLAGQQEALTADIRHAAATGRPLQGMRVLLVDDVDINRKVAHGMLARAGASIIEAKHGQEALDHFENTPDAIDVVLMDVQMPVMDGIMATRLIRKNPRISTMPIVAMTAFVMKEDEARCYEAGMNAYLRKPINPVELYATLLKYKR